MTLITLKPVYDETLRQELGIPLTMTGGTLALGDLSLIADLAGDTFSRFRFDAFTIGEARLGDTRRGRRPSKRRKDRRCAHS